MLFQTYNLQLLILARVGLAVLLGAAIGCERELADNPAARRTHMLAGGATASRVA
jgi:uncharacterized membrane protein YhiD involved in acid resistance